MKIYVFDYVNKIVKKLIINNECRRLIEMVLIISETKFAVDNFNKNKILL